MYPNRITPNFYDYVKMKCPFILIFTGLNVGPLAATTFPISRIYSYPKYAQFWQLDLISRLKSPPFTLHGGLNFY